MIHLNEDHYGWKTQNLNTQHDKNPTISAQSLQYSSEKEEISDALTDFNSWKERDLEEGQNKSKTT